VQADTSANVHARHDDATGPLRNTTCDPFPGCSHLRFRQAVPQHMDCDREGGLHHVPKSEASTPRGHGMLHGDADVALSLSRSEDGLIQASMTKNRNGSSDSKLYFGIRAVTFGIDEDGDAITAPFCDPAEGGRTASLRLPPQPLFALRILNDLILAEGKLLPTGAGFPSDKLRGVPEDRWRAECDSRRLSAAEEQEDRKRVFRNVFQKLQRSSAVAARNGWVWPVRLPSPPLCQPDQSRFIRIDPV
jgi:hypothetical protein